MEMHSKDIMPQKRQKDNTLSTWVYGIGIILLFPSWVLLTF